MSVFKRLKTLLTGSKNDVIEDNSDEKVLNQKESGKPADLRPKQTNSNTKEDEKASSSTAKSKKESKSKDKKAEEKENKDDSKNKEEKGDKMTLLNIEENKLTLDNVDPAFTQIFKDAGIDSVEHCFQCGTCSGGCPSGRRTPYRVRQLVRKCLMGLKDDVIADDALWMCTTCYTCQERCPREIKIVEIVKMARNVAAQNGFMAPAHKATGSFVIKTGHGVPINDATMELRKRVGLGELPPTVHSFPEALEEVQKICEATGFNDLIGFNKETGELE